MEKRIKDKISEIKSYLEELQEIVPDTLKIYDEDFKSKAACERYFEKIVESAIDLAILVIKRDGLNMPKDDESAFRTLFEGGIITEELCKKLIDAKGMRNFIAHRYGEVDDSLVFISLKEELEKDIQTFLEGINEGERKDEKN